MKKLYNLFIGLLITSSIAQAQVVFQSNLSTWSGGLPTDWMGSSTSITAANITEVPAVMYGTSAAQLKNTSTITHRRFSTQTVNVDSNGTYEIKIWVQALAGQIRTGYYNATTGGYGTYNPYVDLAVTSAGSLVMITQSVTVATTTDSAQFILSILGTDGVTDVVVDSVYINTSTPPTSATIYDIQYTITPPYNSPFNAQYVSTGGVVTGVQADGYYLQDGAGSYNGIFVLDSANFPVRGDVVTLSGLVDEYFGLTTIRNITVYNATPGGILPTPAVATTITVNDEQYESVLVKVSGAICIADTTGNTYREWTIDDGSGALIVDDKMLVYQPALASQYNVTGIVDDVSGVFKLLPRDLNDIEIVTSIQEINNYKVSVYPNPVQNQLNFELNASNFSVRIIDVTGKTINNSSTLSNKLKVNTSSLNNGIYFYSVFNNNGEMITSNKFVVAK